MRRIHIKLEFYSALLIWSTTFLLQFISNIPQMEHNIVCTKMNSIRHPLHTQNDFKLVSTYRMELGGLELLL